MSFSGRSPLAGRLRNFRLAGLPGLAVGSATTGAGARWTAPVSAAADRIKATADPGVVGNIGISSRPHRRARAIRCGPARRDRHLPIRRWRIQYLSRSAGVPAPRSLRSARSTPGLCRPPPRLIIGRVIARAALEVDNEGAGRPRLSQAAESRSGVVPGPRSSRLIWWAFDPDRARSVVGRRIIR